MFHDKPFVLLIDDDKDDLEILSTLLNAAGVRTTSYESGTKASLYLQLISDVDELPDLIILDYNMPPPDGRELLGRLKNHSAISYIPVMMYSTGMNEDLNNSLVTLGAFACFQKAWTYDELKNQVAMFKGAAIAFRSKGTAPRLKQNFRELTVDGLA